LPFSASLRSDAPDLLTGRRELEDPAVPRIREEDVALFVDRDPSWSEELVRPLTLEVTVGTEDLNAAVPGVGNVDAIIRSDRDAAGVAKLSGVLAALAEAPQRL